MSETLRNDVLRSHMLLAEQRVWDPLIKKTHDPQSSQQQVLKQILANNAQTSFGKEHGFDSIKTYDQYCAAVPIQSYEDLRPYIDAQEKTKECRLTAEQPLTYAQTSGTTGTPKYIPILPSTMAALTRHQELATFAQYQGVPTIFDGKVLVMSSSTTEGTLKTGTSYGSMSGLLHAALPDVVRDKDVLPSKILQIMEYQKKYMAIAAHALAEGELSVIATANPSTVLKLFDVIRQNLPSLIQLMSPGCETVLDAEIPRPQASSARLHMLKTLVGQEEQLTFESFWPDLRALVTWTGGSCAVLMPRVKSLLPSQTTVIEMGYLSSEFVGSLNIDVKSNRCIPTFCNNFFEFVDEQEWEDEEARMLTLEQLEEGRKYYVIVTTPNGLYRYFMNDIIEVTGRFNQTPTIQFVQKGKGVTSLTGEKLYEHQVITAVEAIKKECGVVFDFFLMLADPTLLEYTLFVEHPSLDDELLSKLEDHLCHVNVEYQAKRKSGRLQPLKVVYVEPGTAEAYKQHCLAKGQREAQFKVVKLQYVKDCSFDFHKHARS